MGMASDFLGAARLDQAQRDADGIEIEMGGLMRDRDTGLVALLESLAEHPELGIRDLVNLARWRLDEGLDRDGLVDPSNGRACMGCVTLIPLDEVETKWARETTDPESGQPVHEEVTPSVLQGKSVDCVAFPGLLEAEVTKGARARARVSYQFVHPSMIRNLDPDARLLALPLLDVEDGGALRRFVDATSSVDLGALSVTADWALSRRYGLSGTREEMFKVALGSELSCLGVHELATRVEVAAMELRRIVAIADQSLDEKPTPLGARRTVGRADRRGDREKWQRRRETRVGDSAREARDGSRTAKGTPEKNATPSPEKQVAASTAEVFAQVDGALKKREQSQSGIFGLR